MDDFEMPAGAMGWIELYFFQRIGSTGRVG
jgi:hypothetical protein